MPTVRCLKIPEKVSFTYVYILNGQKFVKNAKNVNLGEFWKTWSLRSNSVTRKVTFNPNATFWVFFKQCAMPFHLPTSKMKKPVESTSKRYRSVFQMWCKILLILTSRFFIDFLRSLSKTNTDYHQRQLVIVQHSKEKSIFFQLENIFDNFCYIFVLKQNKM